jgi:hypothetical protein
MASPTEDAHGKVHGERGEDYGHPLDDFTTTAELLSALGFLRREKHGEVRKLQAEDIAVQQRMVKESRRYTSPRHYDSLVDIAGYVETDQMVIEERERLSKRLGETFNEIDSRARREALKTSPAPSESPLGDPPIPEPDEDQRRWEDEGGQ